MDRPEIRDFIRREGRVFIATDGRPTATLRELMRLGHRHFAEKYVVEAERKIRELAELRAGLVVHDYGHLQRNKAARAAGLFDAIESLDRPELARKLRSLRDRAAGEERPFPGLLIQINVGRESQKHGIAPEAADAFVEECRALGLAPRGVMAIPPRAADPAPHFRWLRRFADRHALPECHMGMSADYAVAIREGATAIRVGRVLFDSLEASAEKRR